LLSAAQILLSAAVGAVVSLVAVVLYGRWLTPAPGKVAFGWGEAVPLAVVVGLSIVLWRAAGNTPSLNDDPIPLVSPNDVLCPVLTYVCLGLYAGVRQLGQGPEWQRLRAVLTIVSLVVNVATI
jgi:hypothetical protein